jgi:hypothetical protein
MPRLIRDWLQQQTDGRHRIDMASAKPPRNPEAP